MPASAPPYVVPALTSAVTSTSDPPRRRSRTLERGPAYLRIHEELRARILAGHYEHDGPLPSQRALSAEFGVTVMTVRQAIELLKDEGLLLTRPGTGTFAVPRRFAYSIGPLRSLAQEMAAQGLSMRTRVLTFRRVAAPARAAAQLGLPSGAPVYLLERVRSIDGSVAVYQRSHLPLELGRSARRHDLSTRSLYEVFAEELGVAVTRASERMYPIVLHGPKAALLEQPPGSPAILSERLSRDLEDRAVLFDQAFIPGSRLVITAERQTNEMSIRYQLRSRLEEGV